MVEKVMVGNHDQNEHLFPSFFEQTTKQVLKHIMIRIRASETCAIFVNAILLQ